ncbi:MAG: PQQ-dependent sugar dehydrogenase [Chloroflexi bacterium]|nr:PQQ-dependent sugar dehydrogenase [Chloroflexota bacterium]
MKIVLHERGRGRIAAVVLLTIATLLGLSALQTRPRAQAQPQASDTTWPTLETALFAPNFDRPVHLTHANDGSGRVFIVEQRGQIRIVENGVTLSTPFLDITDRVDCCSERGLLSVAFPPDYAQKQYFYVYYIDLNKDTVVARFHTSPQDSDQADPSSEEIILTVDQPFINHNGGQLAFGPDGYLYIGLGDGGSSGDPYNNGQKTNTLLGKILRIDVESGQTPYAIPDDNPYVNTPGYRGEIWALGLRNPWRFSFDRDTGDLYIADVGQDLYEEVNYQPGQSAGGENYGWRIMEGFHCFESPNCDTSGLVLPVVEYDHDLGCSITGGFVYRGPSYPDMEGVYLYGDYCSGRIWGLRKNAEGWENELLLDTSFFITSFGEDEAGEIYVLDLKNGGVHRLLSASPFRTFAPLIRK